MKLSKSLKLILLLESISSTAYIQIKHLLKLAYNNKWSLQRYDHDKKVIKKLRGLKEVDKYLGKVVMYISIPVKGHAGFKHGIAISKKLQLRHSYGPDPYINVAEPIGFKRAIEIIKEYS